ncbi:MAG: hypothetical protein CSA33_02655 [Desulfobulbus propionicus]|nr:MAG: hypothetical protein CSA33_02655 [Desulfobulbus propionicus]
MTIVRYWQENPVPQELVDVLAQSRFPLALTGAGISVPSGIPDFRSADGLWTMFDPLEYATLRVFQRDPGKAWLLYRALGETLEGKQPNTAHKALAKLEQLPWLRGLITQNIDGLHQSAGSEQCLEIHGTHHWVHCLECSFQRPMEANDLRRMPYPCCPVCEAPLKPNIVLFGESVHRMEEVEYLAAQADLLLVIGTSCATYPAADIPSTVHRKGGVILEFNLASCLGESVPSGLTRFFFPGNVTKSLPFFVDQVKRVQASAGSVAADRPHSGELSRNV